MLSQNEVTLARRPDIAQVVKEFGSRLRGFIRKRVNSAEDSEDILQDVFYRLAEADQLMKPVEQLSGWLFTVARNRITDFYRKKRPDLPAVGSEEEDEVILDELTGLMAGSDTSPELEYLRSMIWEELERALDELPPNQRTVFEMNEFEGMSFKEIAALTGETENTLISRKHYAVLHLRERLRDLYYELINF